MPRRSTKHSRVRNQAVFPNRGLDLSKTPTAIHNDALTRAHNFWYEPSHQGIVTRMGTERMKGDKLPGEIVSLVYHVDLAGIGYLVAATVDIVEGKFLYAWRENDPDATWKRIMELQGTPSLMSFDGVLLIADGRNGGLVAWDGLTYEEIQGSPPRPTVMSIIADRVVANSLDAPDAVFFSEPENYLEWGVSEGKAGLIIPAGFGEGMEINALEALYSMLIVSKVTKDDTGQITQKRLHMIATQGAPTSWSGIRLSATNATNVINGMVSVADKVFLVDTDGIQSVAPTEGGTFGDIAVDPTTGVRVQPLVGSMARRATSACVQWIRNLGQLWFIIRAGGASTIVIYHPLHNGAWTEVRYPYPVRCICETGNNIYLGADDGHIYKFTGYDHDSGQAIQTVLRTKKIDQIGGDLILRGAKISMGRLSPARVRVEAVGDDNVTRYLISDFTTETVGSSDDYIYDANYKIYDANWPIFGGGGAVSQIYEWKTAGPREPGISLQIRTTGGRLTVENIQMTIAWVG